MTAEPTTTGEPLPIFGDDDPGDHPRTRSASLAPTRDRWGRSIPAMLAELDAAHAALDAAAAATTAADEAVWSARTDRQEDKARAAWDKVRAAQNRAAGRLHAANLALGRPARDDRR
jgi:hypothetical protein